MRIRSMTPAVLVVAAMAVLTGCGPAGNSGAPDPGAPTHAAVADPSLTAWEDLKVGDCILETDWSGRLSDGGVQVVDCKEAHTDELFAVLAHQLESYPGDEQMLSLSDDACEQAFEEYVGGAHEGSAFDFSYTAPSEATWAAGDRQTLCFLYDAEGDPLSGSARGAEL